MSKKNLSLLMDGFMGEANQAELAKEQPKEKAVEQVAEQAEQPAAQDDKQEIPKAAPAKHLLSRKQPKRLLPSN